MEVGEAGPAKGSVQQSPYLSFEAQAPQWRPLAGREEVTRAAPQRHISRWKAEDIMETQSQLWIQGKGDPAGCSGLQQNEKEPQGLERQHHLTELQTPQRMKSSADWTGCQCQAG